MITIKNVRMLDDQVIDHTIPSQKEYQIDAHGKLLLLPGVIDPHISFGPIGGRNWDLATASAIRGGVTSAIEVPGRDFPCDTKENLELKRKVVEKRLADLEMPLRYYFYGKANLNDIQGLGQYKELINGVFVELDPNKKEAADDHWDKVFRAAAWENLPVIFDCRYDSHEEHNKNDSLLEKAIFYTERQNSCLYVLNVASQWEIDLIQKGRKREVLIYAETTPEHLFQSDPDQAECLWQAIEGRVIETIGSGYDVEHQGKERALFRGGNFSFLDPIFLLPLLFTARKQGKITLEHIVNLTYFNFQGIFNFDTTQDAVLIDLERTEQIQKGTEKLSLTGWPAYTIVQGHIFSSPELGYHLDKNSEF